MEIWKNIDGYDGKYQVSNYGNIRSFTKWKNGKLLKPAVMSTGYFYVALVYDGRKNVKRKVIHRLVANAFLPNPNGLPEVNHIDGNKQNNHVDNLEWVSRHENIRHAVRTGLIKYKYGYSNHSSKSVIQKDKNGNIIKEWGSVADIHRELGYSTNSIICCCNKKPRYKTAYGFLWEYKSGK